MNKEFLFLVVALGAVNFSLRFLPAAVLHRFTISERTRDWLSYVPVATIGALVIPLLVGGKDKLIFLSLENQNLIAAVPAILLAATTRSLALTLGAGMLTMALLRLFT